LLLLVTGFLVQLMSHPPASLALSERLY